MNERIRIYYNKKYIEMEMWNGNGHCQFVVCRKCDIFVFTVVAKTVSCLLGLFDYSLLAGARQHLRIIIISINNCL